MQGPRKIFAYAKRDLKKILGENFLRVIREVTGK